MFKQLFEAQIDALNIHPEMKSAIKNINNICIQLEAENNDNELKRWEIISNTILNDSNTPDDLINDAGIVHVAAQDKTLLNNPDGQDYKARMDKVAKYIESNPEIKQKAKKAVEDAGAAPTQQELNQAAESSGNTGSTGATPAGDTGSTGSAPAGDTGDTGSAPAGDTGSTGATPAGDTGADGKDATPARNNAQKPSKPAYPSLNKDDVITVQKFLNTKLGTNLKTDGKIGPKTTEALQQYAKLKVDKIFGPKTTAAFKNTLQQAKSDLAKTQEQNMQQFTTKEERDAAKAQGITVAEYRQNKTKEQLAQKRNNQQTQVAQSSQSQSNGEQQISSQPERTHQSGIDKFSAEYAKVAGVDENTANAFANKVADEIGKKCSETDMGPTQMVQYIINRYELAKTMSPGVKRGILAIYGEKMRAAQKSGGQPNQQVAATTPSANQQQNQNKQQPEQNQNKQQPEQNQNAQQAGANEQKKSGITFKEPSPEVQKRNAAAKTKEGYAYARKIAPLKTHQDGNKTYIDGVDTSKMTSGEYQAYNSAIRKRNDELMLENEKKGRARGNPSAYTLDSSREWSQGKLERFYT